MSKKQKKTLIRIIISIIFTAAAYFAPLEGIWRLLAFIPSYLIIGYDVLWSAARNIAHGQVFDEQFLMAFATIGAFAIGDYPEASAVMIFYQTGELFQSIAVGKSRKSIASLMDIRPDHAVVVKDGKEQEVSPEEVKAGETIIVRPGERIPLDGEIISGSTSVNSAALTGESVPVDKAVGDKVISGTINLNGVIEVRTESNFSESTVSKILELVENSSEKKAKTENFITRFSRYYTPCVVCAAVLLAILPPLFFNGIWSEWVNRALLFLVVSCPCALVISVPLSFFGGIGGASRDGILIKGANYLETLAGVDTVVFDKTGTLTMGSFSVNAVHPERITAARLLDIAAAAESFSNHPVAESIVIAHGGHINKKRVKDVEEIAGMGIFAQIDGETYYVGNGALMDKAGAKWHECHLTGTIVHVSRDSEYLGHIVINDSIKEDSVSAVASLKALGVKKTVMLTGDSDKVAQAVGKTIGIDEIHAKLFPKDKVDTLEEIMKTSGGLAFIGDGINDAPVLTRADVGIAMGALGSDAAIEAADIVLMDDKPTKIATAIKISRKTMRIVRENIVFALAVKAVILVLGAVGIASMWIAVFGDVGVMIIAIMNALRAMRKIR